MEEIMCLTEPYTLGIPQVIQSLNVFGVIQVIGVLRAGQIKATDAHVIRQQQHRRIP